MKKEKAIEIKFSNAPITVNEIKLNIFKPLTRIGKHTFKQDVFNTIFDNEDFLVQMKGTELTQVHRNILDVTLTFGKKKYYEDLGQVAIFLSPYSILKNLGYENGNNYNWLMEKLSELQTTEIKIYDKCRKTETIFNFLESARHSKKEASFALVFSKSYIAYFMKEISINYLCFITEIIETKHSITKAIMRYFLSFRNSFQIDLDKVFIAIGVLKENMSSVTYREKKRMVLEDKALLESVGIFIIRKHSRQKEYLINYDKKHVMKTYYPSRTHGKESSENDNNLITHDDAYTETNEYADEYEEDIQYIN